MTHLVQSNVVGKVLDLHFEYQPESKVNNVRFQIPSRARRLLYPRDLLMAMTNSIFYAENRQMVPA